jgi:uncharacterized glyoxalase superfamily protein PhnB
MDYWERIEESLESIRRSTVILSENLVEMRKKALQADRLLDDLNKEKSRLNAMEADLNKLTQAVSNIEDSVRSAMESARKGAYSSDLSVELRTRLLDMFRHVFSELQSAGIEVIIPKLGDKIDPRKHAVKGRAKSPLSSDEIADVITWGYSFPSGAVREAEVLVGDGTQASSEQEPSVKPQPTKVKGIAMIVEEDSETPKTRKKSSVKTGGALFDKLAEAAEKNKDKLVE